MNTEKSFLPLISAISELTMSPTGEVMPAWKRGFCLRIALSSVVPARGKPEMKWSLGIITCCCMTAPKRKIERRSVTKSAGKVAARRSAGARLHLRGQFLLRQSGRCADGPDKFVWSEFERPEVGPKAKSMDGFVIRRLRAPRDRDAGSSPARECRPGRSERNGC